MLLTLAMMPSRAHGGETKAHIVPQDPLGTSFTYQGRLTDSSSPANGQYDFRFDLYEALTGGSALDTVTIEDQQVTDGLFTVQLDFGPNTFLGEARYLAINVRPGTSTGSYTSLTPRQPLTAAPHAHFASRTPWSGLIDVPADLADGDDDTTYTAGDGLVLDGTEFSAQGSSYANVVIVAKSGGDYTSVQTAIDSITDANVNNPYLVWVAPGVYSETVAMKPHVHLQGAGQKATVIASSVANDSYPPTQATLVLTRATSLRDLSVGNNGVGERNAALLAMDGTTRTLVADVTVRSQGVSTYSHAIFLSGSDTSVTLQDVTGLIEGDNNNHGLYNTEGAKTILRGGSITARGGNSPRAIYNVGLGTTLEAEGVTVLAENGTSNYGLFNMLYGTATLRGGSSTARGGNSTRGIYNRDYGTILKATGVTVLAENGSSSNIGLFNEFSATAEVNSSRLIGSPSGLYLDGGTVYLGVTQLDSGASNTSGTLTCFQVYDGSYGSYACP